MKKTKQRDTDVVLAVDINKLAGMLSCGQSTARKIAVNADAKIVIGRRTLYSVEKIQMYLNELTN